MSLGELLRSYRLAAHLSQARLGELAGLGRDVIANLESGRRGRWVTAEQIEAIANALEVPPDMLMAAAGLGPPTYAPLRDRPTFEAFVATEPTLNAEQRSMFLLMYQQIRRGRR